MFNYGDIVYVATTGEGGTVVDQYKGTIYLEMDNGVEMEYGENQLTSERPELDLANTNSHSSGASVRDVMAEQSEIAINTISPEKAERLFKRLNDLCPPLVNAVVLDKDGKITGQGNHRDMLRKLQEVSDVPAAVFIEMIDFSDDYFRLAVAQAILNCADVLLMNKARQAIEDYERVNP